MLEYTVPSRWPAKEGYTGFLPILQQYCCLCTGAQLRWYHLSGGWQSLFLLEQMFRSHMVKQLTTLHLCCWDSSGREERRGGILLLYALRISSKKHKLETSSLKEISEIAYLAHPSRQPRYQMLGTHTGELWSCSGENVYFVTALRADVMSQSLGKATLGKV